MATKEQVDKSILAEYRDDAGWQPWFNEIDAEVAAESKCDLCGTERLKFHGFQGYGERHAVAECRNPKCGHQFEF